MININKNVRDDAYGDSTPEMNTFNRTRDIIKRITGMVDFVMVKKVWNPVENSRVISLILLFSWII